MNKTKIRALILDYGGVISLPQNPQNVDNILTRLGKERNDFRQVYRSWRPMYDNGQLSGTEYWAKILEHYRIEPDEHLIARIIREDVQSWTHLNDQVLEFIRERRNQVGKLAIISNMTRETLAFMREHFEWLDLFDELTFSCAVGINKPAKAIYETCLGRLGVPPGECLFVDDSPENVHAAQAMGMAALHFTTFAEFEQQVDESFCLTR
jgi:putative hydrolase of the HAD superfamily